MRGPGWVMVLTLCSATALADHLPPAMVARGRAEHVLAGIDVYKTSVDSLMTRFGKPVSFKKYPQTEESGEVVWQLKGSTVHASMNADGTAYAVEVSGAPSEVADTGRGLKLGASLADAERMYGTRSLRRGDQVTYQWSDETELRLHLVGKRIQSMLLIANVE